ATEGIVTEWLTKAAGQLATIRAGIVVRDAQALANLLGITDVDPASEAAATLMAQSIGERAGADFGLAVAAPPATDNDHPFIALATPDGVRAKGFPVVGHPAVRRPRAAKNALNMLRLALLNRSSPSRTIALRSLP